MDRKEQNYNTAEDFFNKYIIQEEPSHEFIQNTTELVLKTYTNTKQTFNISNLFNNQKLVVAMFSVISILFIAFAFTLPQLNKSEIAQVQKVAANIDMFEGSLIANNNGGWYNITSKVEITENTNIKLDGKGKAIINFSDGTTLRINSNTELIIKSLVENNLTIETIKGEIFARVPLNSNLKIQNNEMLYSIENSVNKTKKDEKINKVEVLKNKIKIIKDSNEIALVNEGQIFDCINEEIKDLKLEEIKKDEFTIWNRKLDAESEKYSEEMGILKDLEAPEIEIIEPKGGVKTESENIEIKGKTEPGVKLLINKIEVKLNNGGEFTSRIKLKDGENELVIEAIDNFGNKATQKLTVTKKTPEPEVVRSYIYLTGSSNEQGKVTLQWYISGLTIPEGVKVLKNDKPSLSFPANAYAYISEQNTNSQTVHNLQSGSTYYFRVCRYVNGLCDFYSNEIAVTVR